MAVFIKMVANGGVSGNKFLQGLDCPSSNDLGHVILFPIGGSGSSRFDVKPLGVDGSSGALGWSVS